MRTAAAILAALVVAACGGADALAAITVTRVLAPAPVITGGPADATMAVYATITNRGGGADTLAAVETDAAGRSGIHATMDHGGMAMMMPADDVVIPADSVIVLAPGGTHVMLESLTRAIAPGDSVSLVFMFRVAGPVTAVARVVAYDQLERALAADRAP